MGVGSGTKGRKKPRTGWGRGFFLNFFFFLVVVGAGGVTQTGRQGGNYNPWFRLSYAGKEIFLISPHAKKENHLELCTDSNYVPPAVSRPQPTVPSNGHQPGLQAARRTTAQGPLPQSLSSPPGRSQTQNAALSRRVLNTFHH